MGFRYPRFYFSVIRSINIVSATTVEAAAQAENTKKKYRKEKLRVEIHHNFTKS
jgi:hypothetical protein